LAGDIVHGQVADGVIYTVPDYATYDFNRLDLC
jgi:hypothetical protein